MIEHIDTQLVIQIRKMTIDPYQLVLMKALHQGIGSNIVFVMAPTNMVTITDGIASKYPPCSCQKLSSTKG
jgi:hypothetical protein